MITTLLQCAIGQAGRLIAAAAVLYFLFSEYLGLGLPTWVYGLALALFSVSVILGGRYRAIEIFAKVAAGLLVASTVIVYFVQPAPVSEFSHFFIFEAPEGSWLVIAAFLGLLPTGIDVSLQASEWGKAKRVGMSKIRRRLEILGLATRFDPFEPRRGDLTVDTSRLPDHARRYANRWFRIGLLDFRFGHTVSAILAVIFLLLAAVWMYPSPVEGRAVMGEIAQIFTLSVGPWMMVVFLIGAFAATFSTAFNYFDGWPRIVGACCRNLFTGTASLQGTARRRLTDKHRKTWYSEYNIYRMTMFYSLIASVIIIAGYERPVQLVLIASALAYFVAPVIFFLNLYYCLTVIPKDDKLFYPSAGARWFAYFSLAGLHGAERHPDRGARLQRPAFRIAVRANRPPAARSCRSDHSSPSARAPRVPDRAGKTVSTSGTMLRSAKSGSTASPNAATISAFSCTGRERSTDPIRRCRLTMRRARLISAATPPMTPISISVPPTASAARFAFR